MSSSSRYYISLDLGSDSTVAFVKRPMDSEYQLLDLQYFGQALAAEPRLLEDDQGRPLRRLRSRYGVNREFTVGEPLEKRTDPDYGYVEMLPAEHATTDLVDFDSYIVEHGRGGDLSRFGRPNKCLFKFFDDKSHAFPLESLLPNAKLVFQAGIGMEREFEVRVKDGQPERYFFEPAEIIKNQICLILENFVRQHPFMREGRGRPPEWDECTVVLTVPNTYSPLHRDLLAKMVRETLHCPVETITESDAVVFYYLAQAMPNLGLDSELGEWTHHYLTIDVGKGTTDLTLMDVSFRVPNERTKTAYEIAADDNRLRQHVFVLARTGRPSGGARVTFLIAEFLEKLIDIALRAELPDESGSPIRLTRRGPFSPSESHTKTRAFLAFETICEKLKRTLDLEAGAAVFPDPGSTDDSSFLSAYLARQVPDAFDPRGVKYPDIASVMRNVDYAVRRVLEFPSVWRGEVATQNPAQSAEIEKAYKELRDQIAKYVHENVDELLIELAQAHLSENESTGIRNAGAALRAMVAEPSPRPWAKMDDTDRDIRTHVIIAGQASQFAPLRRRLEQIIREARLGEIQSQSLSQAPAPAPLSIAAEVKSGGIKKVLGLFAPKKLTGPMSTSPDRNRAVELDPQNLKDGCAYGALDWLLNEPIMMNKDHVHGQLAVDIVGGGDLKWVDMDSLNDEHKIDMRFQNVGRREVYFLSGRGVRDEHPKRSGGVVMGTTASCGEIRVQIRPATHPGTQLVVTTERDSIKLKETVYGGHEKDELRPLLWPAVLLD